MARFHRFGVEKVVFAPAVNSLTAPTRPEISAGVVLVNPGVRTSEGLNEMSGFERRTTFIDTPDAATDFDSKITGRTQAGDPMLRFYEDNSSATIRTALAEGTAGFLIRMVQGDSTGKPAEVYPVTSGAVVRSPLTSGNDAATYEVSFAVTAAPEVNATVPAP
jgi:hypothetical protein